jgi:hypothetical protein
MNVKEISKQLRMLDTKFANAKKHLAALNLEQDAEESIIETLDAQHLVLAKKKLRLVLVNNLTTLHLFF